MKRNFIDRHLHPDLLSNELVMARARIITGFILLNLIILPVADILILIVRSIPEHKISTVNLFFTFQLCLYLICWVLVKKTAALRLVANLVLGINYLQVSTGAFLLWPLNNSPITYLYIVLAIMAFLFTGLGYGFLWSLLFIASHGYFIFANPVVTKLNAFVLSAEVSSVPVIIIFFIYFIAITGLAMYERINARLIRHIRMESREFQREAEIDALTGLANRRRFDTMLPRVMEDAIISQGSFALMVFDLNDFKPVNDRYGHEAGDELLKKMGTRLKGTVRSSDYSFRFGGDEFAIIFTGIGKMQNAVIAAKQVLNAISQPVQLEAGTVSVGAAAGIAVYPVHAFESAQLFRLADKCMYLSKKNKKPICFPEEL